jgi:hypothetical protein
VRLFISSAQSNIFYRVRNSSGEIFSRSPSRILRTEFDPIDHANPQTVSFKSLTYVVKIDRTGSARHQGLIGLIL